MEKELRIMPKSLMHTEATKLDPLDIELLKVILCNHGFTCYTTTIGMNIKTPSSMP